MHDPGRSRGDKHAVGVSFTGRTPPHTQLCGGDLSCLSLHRCHAAANSAFLNIHGPVSRPASASRVMWLGSETGFLRVPHAQSWREDVPLDPGSTPRCPPEAVGQRRDRRSRGSPPKNPEASLGSDFRRVPQAQILGEPLPH